MKSSKYLFLAIMAVILVGCDTNDPTQQLIGTWSEPYHVNNMVQSITFKSNGMAIYKYEPDTTFDIVVAEGGCQVYFKYSVVSNSQLKFTSYERQSDKDRSNYFNTNYSITHNVLIIDKLSLGDYGCVTSLKLEKQ